MTHEEEVEFLREVMLRTPAEPQSNIVKLSDIIDQTLEAIKTRAAKNKKGKANENAVRCVQKGH